MSFKDFINNNQYNKFLIIIAAAAVIIFIFSAGVFVGSEKARFSFGWEKNYYNNFVGQRGMMPFDRGFLNARGLVGEIMKIDGNNIIIKGNDNIEKIVAVSSSTVIRNLDKNIGINELKIGDNIVVMGSPNDQGQIEPKLIRVLPSKNGLLPAANPDMMRPPLNN